MNRCWSELGFGYPGMRSTKSGSVDSRFGSRAFSGMNKGMRAGSVPVGRYLDGLSSLLAQFSILRCRRQ